MGTLRMTKELTGGLSGRPRRTSDITNVSVNS